MKDMIDRVNFETLQDHGRNSSSVVPPSSPVFFGVLAVVCFLSLVYVCFF